MLSNSFHITDDYLDNIEAAIEQVQEVIESIDMLLSLFPSSKSLTDEFKEAASKDYQVRTL